ncbi:MAG: hypothetical protein H3C34_03315 [Caldilineaceae bacterium]|nr:hypothetical protein [Caldilineaceae bacterium]
MISQARLLIAGLLIAVACTSPMKPTCVAGPSNADPDSDAISLVAMGEQAMQIVQANVADAVLRQIDTGINKTVFHFTDGAATTVTQIVVPTAETPPDKWIVEDHLISPLVSHSERSLNLQSLEIGPHRVARAITAHWPGCVVRRITL